MSLQGVWRGGRIENSKLRALWGLGITWTPKECRRIAFILRGFGPLFCLLFFWGGGGLGFRELPCENPEPGDQNRGSEAQARQAEMPGSFFKTRIGASGFRA